MNTRVAVIEVCREKFELHTFNFGTPCYDKLTLGTIDELCAIFTQTLPLYVTLLKEKMRYFRAE